MSDWSRASGSNWLKGPYYPQSGWGKWTSTPISRLPKWGTIGAVITAGRAGWTIGTTLDRQFGLSNRISDHMANRTPSSVKWWIHKHL